MPLTDTAIRAAKPKDGKQTKKFDGGGLYLLVRTNGSKLWQMAYRFAGKAKVLSFGPYPDVSLIEAREQREAARKLLREGVDPSVQKKLDRLATEIASENSFGAVRRDFIDKLRKDGLSEITIGKKEWILDHAKALDGRPFADVKPIEILGVILSIQGDGKQETAHRVSVPLVARFREAGDQAAHASVILHPAIARPDKEVVCDVVPSSTEEVP